MKKYRSLIVLFIVLILPLVVYVVLKLTSTQNYRPIETIGEKIPNPDGSPDSVFKAIGNFSLVNQDGVPLTTDSLKGKIWVANLFYGSCSDVCDVMNGWIKQMLTKDFPNDKGIRFLSFSIDPGNDSIASIQAYAKRMEALPGRWDFLTGNPDLIWAFLEKELKYPRVDSAVIDRQGLHDHTFRLIDWKGNFRGFFYSGDVESQMVTMAQHIVFLQKERDGILDQSGRQQ